MPDAHLRPGRRGRWFTVVAAIASMVAMRPALTAGAAPPPPKLSDTSLFVPGSVDRVRDDVLAFTPQYPLWTDGADKRRWLRLPPGTHIDASDPDRWVFPPGTQLWKEFSFAGRRVETRYITRDHGGAWHFATYVWAEDGGDAVLARDAGVPALPVPQAPGGRYAIPSRSDCLVCHDSAPVPVLGVGALQLSGERDPGSHALARRGWLEPPPSDGTSAPPRIAARTADERAALGYLHGNCGHCHNDDGSPAPVPLVLAQRVHDPAAARDRVLASLVDVLARYRPPGAPEGARLIAPGRPDASLLWLRMRSRHPQMQMPPLGTVVPDPEGLALIQRWISNDLSTQKEMNP